MVHDLALTPDLAAKRLRLLEILRGLESVAVAFSGGIDSTVVAQAAWEALGSRAIAVTADSPSVPRSELAEARELAARIGIQHVVVPAVPKDPEFLRRQRRQDAVVHHLLRHLALPVRRGH